MPAPVVCPSCSRVFQPTLDACPACGWDTTLSANDRRTKVISHDPFPVPKSPAAATGASTRFAKIELATVPSRAPLELPPEEPVTAPARPAIAARPGAPAAGALELPPEEPVTEPARPATSRGALSRPGEPVTEPRHGRPGSTSTSAPIEAPRPSVAPSRPLELPPDITDAPELPLPRASAPRPSAPKPAPPAPATASLEDVLPAQAPAWLSEPLHAWARRTVVLTGPLTLLALIDAATAGRPEVSGAASWVGALALVAATVLLARLHAAALLAATGAGLLLAFTGLDAGVLGVELMLVWTAAVPASLLIRRAQPFALALGLLATVGLAPAMLDGVTPAPLGGVLRARLSGGAGERVSWPFVDQRSGLQLASGSASLRAGEPSEVATRLVDPALGFEVAFGTLPPRLELVGAGRAGLDWLAALGLTHVSAGEGQPLPGRFDVATVMAFTADHERARQRGFIRVAVLGDETFVMAAWTRAHRAEALTQPMRAVIDQTFYRPAALPRLSPEQRAGLSGAIVTTRAQELTGVRVAAGDKGDKVVLLLPATGESTGQAIELRSGQGVFPVDLSTARTTSGVRLAPLGGGQAAPLRALAGAPRHTRIVVSAGGWLGGWLTDEPGAPIRRAEVPHGQPGPVFDLEGHLVGVATRGDQGLTVTTVDALQDALTLLTGSRPSVKAATTATPPPLYAPATPQDDAALEPADVTRSVVLARSGTAATAATVIGENAGAWALAADAVIAPPGSPTASIRMPGGELRAADVVRTRGRVALLKLPKEVGDGLRVLPLVESAAATPGSRVTWGFRDDPATATLTLKASSGLLSGEGYELDPGPALTGGPVLSADGRVAALRVAGAQAVASAKELQALTVPGVKDVFWRIAAEPTGTCQLAATIEIEDPLDDATLIRVRVVPETKEAPARLTVPSFTDAVPEKGAAKILFRFRCFAEPQLMQFEVQGPSGARASRIQRIPVITVWPGVVRGRTGPSPESARAPAALLSELWEIPPPVTLHHACRSEPEKCERACYVDELDACTLDGRFALATKEIPRAVGRLDDMCAQDDVEACTLLLWALAEQKTKRVPKSKPERVLEPWCAAGAKRACAALAIPEWRKALAEHAGRCAKSPKACDDLARHLLTGPRLDVDITRALKAFQHACGAFNDRACGDSAVESLRFERETALMVLARARRGCAAGHADACLLEAMNAATGLTVPRTPQAAEKLIEETCAAGSVEACLMTLP